jgi:hypothetical protein
VYVASQGLEQLLELMANDGDTRPLVVTSRDRLDIVMGLLASQVRSRWRARALVRKQAGPTVSLQLLRTVTCACALSSIHRSRNCVRLRLLGCSCSCVLRTAHGADS